MTTPLRRALALLAGWSVLLAVLVAVVLYLVGVGLWLAVGLAAATGVLVALAAYLLAPAITRRVVRAAPIEPGAQPRLRNVVEGVCASNGLAEPNLHLTAGSAPNALVVGRRSGPASLVVTDGLIGHMRRIELEGVVAHLLTRVRAGQIAAETLAVVVAGIPLAGAAELRVRALRWIVGDDHAMRADFDGVGMTRYPPGLTSALARMAEAEGVVRSAPRAAQHLWINEPITAPGKAVHRPLSERIDALQEL